MAKSGTDLTRVVTNPLEKKSTYTYTRSGDGPHRLVSAEIAGGSGQRQLRGVKFDAHVQHSFLLATEKDEEGRTTAYTRDSPWLSAQNDARLRHAIGGYDKGTAI